MPLCFDSLASSSSDLVSSSYCLLKECERTQSGTLSSPPEHLQSGFKLFEHNEWPFKDDRGG